LDFGFGFERKQNVEVVSVVRESMDLNAVAVRLRVKRVFDEMHAFDLGLHGEFSARDFGSQH
jgi:hypothetical protein